MYLRVALKHVVRRFGGVNVPPGRGQRQGPRGFHTLYVPGRACEQGPGRFGHVNVGGASGLGGPAGQVQSVTAMADSSRRMNGIRTLTSVSSTVRRPRSGTWASWSQSWRVGLSPGLGGPSVALGPLRVGEWMRERVLGLSAVWPLVCASVSSDSRPCGRWTLAVWPLDSRRVAWPHLCTLPVPQWCPMVVSLCEDNTTIHGLLSYRGLSGLRATAAGRSRMRRAVILDSASLGGARQRDRKRFPD